MKFFRKTMKKGEKNQGQVLVILAIVMIVLLLIVGLAVDTGYMYVSYSRLNRAVDAAGLAATGEFKRPVNGDLSEMNDRMQAAAQQQLDLNGVNGTSKVDWCFTDASLCQNAQGNDVKQVRISVTENVPTFFMALMGFRQIPITVQSVSTAASVDVVVVIDSSESMTYDVPSPGVMRDPKNCNPHSCQPFEKLKTAAKDFAEHVMFAPYDRMSIVSFDQFANMAIELSGDLGSIDDAIDNLTVFQPQRCPYSRQLLQNTYGTLDPSQIPAPPPVADNPAVLKGYTKDPQGPCRFLASDGGVFLGLDCPMDYSPTPDPSHCGSTNTSAGIMAGGAILQGRYNAGFATTSTTINLADPTTWPKKRDQSLWVMVLLSDGSTNSAYDTDRQTGNTIAICPKYTWAYNFGNPYCQDQDASLGSRHTPEWLDKNQTVLNPLYDADDMARDAIDGVTTDGTIIFTVGLGGSGITKIPAGQTLAPGEQLLEYPFITTDNGGPGNLGEYKYADNGSSLSPIFLAIANKIATRLTQ